MPRCGACSIQTFQQCEQIRHSHHWNGQLGESLISHCRRLTLQCSQEVHESKGEAPDGLVAPNNRVRHKLVDNVEQ